MNFMLGTLSGVILFLLATLVWLELEHKKERNDLYNRLMARDYGEYKTQERSSLPKNQNFVARGIEQGARSIFGPE